MNTYEKIYVAGHKGLVGSSILRKLDEKDFRNIITRTSNELDLRVQKEVEEFFSAESPECVFLAAAKVGGILANSTYKAEFIYDNLMIAANVIHTSYRFGVKKLLNLGSSCIYPKSALQPMREEYLLTGNLEPTNEPYAISKIAAIKLCRYYNEQYGTNFVSVMPTNLYGPNDNFNLETAHVLPAMIRKFHLAKLLRNGDFEGVIKDLDKFPIGFGLNDVEIFRDKDSVIEILKRVGIARDYVELWGSGEPYREFLFVDDLAEACLYIMENYGYEDVGEFINIGTGKDMKIREIAEMVREIVNFEGEIRFDTTKPDGSSRKLLDISRISKFGWRAMTPLIEGIKKTYEWYVRD